MYVVVNKFIDSINSRHYTLEKAIKAQELLAIQIGKLPGRCYLRTQVWGWVGEGVCPAVGSSVEFNDCWVQYCTIEGWEE